MRPTAVSSKGNGPNVSPLDMLTAQIGRLLRHPAYRRESIVSSLLQRHLPKEAGYAWNDEAALRERLGRAGLDAASIDHLIRNTQAEIQRLRGPADA